MEILENVFFDPEVDGKPRTSFLVGTFPAHIVAYEPGDDINGSIPNNITVQFDDSIKGLTGVDYRNDNKEVPADHMAGKELRSIAFWLTKNPGEGEGWKNTRYNQMAEAMGFELPDDGNGKKMQIKLNEVDLLGLPCLVDVKLEKSKNNGNLYPKVFNLTLWEDGEKIEVKDEEVNAFENDDDAELESDEELDKIFGPTNVEDAEVVDEEETDEEDK